MEDQVKPSPNSSQAKCFEWPGPAIGGQDALGGGFSGSQKPLKLLPQRGVGSPKTLNLGS